MFINIERTVAKKKQNFIKSNQQQNSVDVLFARFLEKIFPQQKSQTKTFLNYDPAGRRLVVETDNKVIANEIALRAKDLLGLLRKEGFLISSIVIR